ncbi:Core 1 synthase, glycoprotein-N-acetylgalactosamine 3-beta-galactosyltransferase, 1 [Cichlidogyrus casuarinus]|uniref:Core 1 synthase, glycoprotein-N-acetylgalactosamine 3-beta-galactosyltransferase, 1 n=1 Tax=Cichlidogyrus casuarinus TaxID=1844966 RepID=A0ABD2PUR9_9PLAT
MSECVYQALSYIHQGVPVVERSTKNSLNKTLTTIQFLHKQYGHKYDFFLKADDDTYIVMDNLRDFLRDLDPQKKIIAGRRFKNLLKKGYVKNNASYVLSRASLHAIAEQMENDKEKPCYRDSKEEDLGLAYCAEQVGVDIVDTLDKDGLERFHPLNADGMWDLDPNQPTSIHTDNYYPLQYVGVHYTTTGSFSL